MAQRSESGGARWATAALGLLVALGAIAPSAGAQGNGGSLVDHMGFDKLQIVSMGLSGGWIVPSQVVPTNVFGVSADYGEFAPSWHLVVNASYWKSAYRDAIVQTFVDSLNRNLSGTGTNRVLASRVSLYDVTFGGEARYTPTYSGELKPFLGLGLAAHVINAEGALIKGTFVERALDDITAGLFVTGGVSFKIVKHLGFEGTLRGDLLSGFRSSQARIGATYFFGNVHGIVPGSGGN